MITVTSTIMILTALVWIIWDVYLYANKKETISQIVTKFAWYSPVLPLICGILMGHWFWPA